MERMPSPNWNSLACSAALYACVLSAHAQAPAVPVVSKPASAATARPAAPATEIEDIDLLVDALTCRVPDARYAALMQQLRRERPEDFAQAYRQYSSPPMDLYRLQNPISAWGNTADTVLISANRVTMAVVGGLDEVTSKLESALEKSSDSPLSAALDDQHALVIFEASQPGLEGSVLVGCEYRMEGVSLLDDPDEAWRRQPAPSAPKPNTP